MAIKNWHWGKIVLSWVLAGLGIGVLAQFVKGHPSPSEVQPLGWIVLSLSLAALVSAFVVTWQWLSGKEGK